MIPLIAALSLAVTVVAVAAVVRTRFVVVSVSGPSMEPVLSDGDRLLVRRRPLRRVRGGDVVVLANPQPGAAWIVKRAAAVPGEPVPALLRDIVGEAVVRPGRFLVLGDNPDVSFDSRRFGYRDAGQLLGVMVRRMG